MAIVKRTLVDNSGIENIRVVTRLATDWIQACQACPPAAASCSSSSSYASPSYMTWYRKALSPSETMPQISYVVVSLGCWSEYSGHRLRRILCLLGEGGVAKRPMWILGWQGLLAARSVDKVQLFLGSMPLTTSYVTRTLT
jgi:hypothetical protein